MSYARDDGDALFLWTALFTFRGVQVLLIAKNRFAKIRKPALSIINIVLPLHNAILFDGFYRRDSRNIYDILCRTATAKVVNRSSKALN